MKIKILVELRTPSGFLRQSFLDFTLRAPARTSKRKIIEKIYEPLMDRCLLRKGKRPLSLVRVIIHKYYLWHKGVWKEFDYNGFIH